MPVDLSSFSQDAHSAEDEPSDPSPLIPERSGAATDAFQLDDLRQFFADLVPESGQPVEWVDATGRKYTAAPLLSAKRLFRLKEALLRIGGDLAEPLQRLGTTMDPGAIVGVLGATMSEGMLADLDLLFTIALPDQLREARAEAGLGDATPTALFPFEEIVRALVPFCARPIAVLLGLAK